MSTKVLYCYDDDDTTAVAKNMGENRVRRLPVLNREKRLVGIISLGDIAVSQESNLQITADAFRAISRNGSDQVAATA
jgi:CBS domain-containing protein